MRGLAIGCAAGALASWVMSRAYGTTSAAARKILPPKREPAEAEASTLQVAEAVSNKVFHRPIPENRRQIAGNAVHYAFGTLTGGLFGAMSEYLPAGALGAGLLYGAAVWLLVDEGLVPALGFARSPREYPAADHASALANHLIYGGTLGLVKVAAPFWLRPASNPSGRRRSDAAFVGNR